MDASYRAHLLHTGEEMWEQSEGAIDVFLDIVGSGGTFEGGAEALKQHNPNIRAYLVEPKHAAVYAGQPLIDNGRHKVQGCGYAVNLPKMKQENIDGLIQVTDEKVLQMTR